jgi:hypothetical protein
VPGRPGARSRRNCASSLTEAARERRRRFVAELDELNTRLREKYGELPDSTPLIREDRDQYG